MLKLTLEQPAKSRVVLQYTRLEGVQPALGVSPAAPARIVFENLEDHARHQVEVMVQDLLEEERDRALGRDEYERKETPGPGGGYRNGYGKPRQLATSMGTVTVRRPRVRGLEERFESAILPLFVRRTKQVAELLPELYLHGLSEGDFDKALRGLLGDAAPLSASSIARLKAKWQAEYEAWKQRRLDDLDVVYVWVDGVYVKAGLEKEKAALLVIVAALRDGSNTNCVDFDPVAGSRVVVGIRGTWASGLRIESSSQSRVTLTCLPATASWVQAAASSARPGSSPTR